MSSCNFFRTSTECVADIRCFSCADRMPTSRRYLMFFLLCGTNVSSSPLSVFRCHCIMSDDVIRIHVYCVYFLDAPFTSGTRRKNIENMESIGHIFNRHYPNIFVSSSAFNRHFLFHLSFTRSLDRLVLRVAHIKNYLTLIPYPITI